MRKIFFLLFSFSIIAVAKAEVTSTDSVKYRFAPLIVTGQRYQMPQKDAAASISIITPIALRETNFTTVADAISYLTPGVFTTRRTNLGYGVAALAGGSITIRGVGGKPNSQVLILIDGRPDFQGIFSHPLNDAYQLDNVDHIEILRGPASAVYGTNALGGVINIITHKLPTTGFHTDLKIGYGTYNTQKYLLRHSGVLGKLKYFGAFSINKTDGHRSNSEFNSKNYALKLGYQFNSHFELSLNGTATPYEFHDPGPENIDLMGYFGYGDISRNSLDITLSNRFAQTDGTIKIHGNFGKHRLSDGWYSEDQTNGIILFQNFTLPYDLKTTVGFDIKRFGGTAKSNGVKLGTFFNDEYAGYLHLQKILFQKLILGTGIRVEDNSHFGREWIPKFGVVYHPFTGTAVRASAAKGFRTPSIKDLYLFPTANENLQPEQLWNYEVGFSQTLGELASLDICGFYYEGKQLIDVAKIAPGKMQNQNISNNKARGLEITLHTTPIRNFTANISYSYLNSEKILPFAPNKLNFLLNYRLSKLTVAAYGEYITNLYTSYQLNQFPPTTTLEKLADYTLVHLKLQYLILPQLTLSLSVENVFDQSYQILKGYPMPGRTIFSSLTVGL